MRCTVGSQRQGGRRLEMTVHSGLTETILGSLLGQLSIFLTRIFANIPLFSPARGICPQISGGAVLSLPTPPPAPEYAPDPDPVSNYVRCPDQCVERAEPPVPYIRLRFYDAPINNLFMHISIKIFRALNCEDWSAQFVLGCNVPCKPIQWRNPPPTDSLPR